MTNFFVLPSEEDFGFSTAHDVKSILETENITDIYVGMEPVSPENVITIYDTGGAESDTDEMDIERPTFQIRVRNKNYLTAFALHRHIKKVLQRNQITTVGSRVYIGFSVTMDISKLGESDRNSHLVVASYRAIVRSKET